MMRTPTAAGLLSLALSLACAKSGSTTPADAGYSGILCSGMRVDPRTDSSNCGRCYNRCIGDETCENGICRPGMSGCVSPRIRCGDGCVDLSTDPENCGVCGVGCLPGDDCLGGECETPITPRDAGPPRDSGGIRDGGRRDARTPRDAGPLGDAGACEYDTPDVCFNVPSLWCRNRRCGECEDNFFNCDHTRGCECEMGCDGTACLPEFACDPAMPNPCGTPERWCYAGHPSGTPQCRQCSDVRGSDGIPDRLNCDGEDGCEHRCPDDMGPCTCP